MLHSFKLLPFHKNSFLDSIHGNIRFTDDEISITYQLSGSLADIDWPDSAGIAPREYGLWEATCLEFFIRPSGGQAYLEVNINPGGSWNCFSFTGLRTNMKESDELLLLNTIVKKNDHAASLEARLRWTASRAVQFTLGISAVICQQNCHHYYALAHMGDRPDFHSPENHTLLINCKTQP